MDLKAEQEITLKQGAPKLPLFMRLLVGTMDLFYWKARTLPKFVVLELLARYPYWAWEDGGYRMLSSKYTDSERTAQALQWIELSREAQDNEQWHLLLLDEIVRKRGEAISGFFRGVFVPRLLAFGYYHISRLLFRCSPKSGFLLNAAFEAHAEHEYMLMVQEHPEWKDEQIDSKWFEYYPRQNNLADLLRQIALDERKHKEDSLAAAQEI